MEDKACGLLCIHQHNAVGMGCPHVWSHPGLINLEFGRIYITFRHTSSLGHFRLEWKKTVGVNPG